MRFSKKQLLKEIENLKRELEQYKTIEKLREKNGLSECKGIICRECEHSVYVRGLFGEEKLVGCDLTSVCKDYKRRFNSVQKEI